MHEPSGAPIVSIGIGGHSKCGPKLWRMLHEISPELAAAYGIQTRPDRCPPEPWCAARIEPGVMLVAGPGSDVPAGHELLAQIADFERALAWAALEMH